MRRGSVFFLAISRTVQQAVCGQLVVWAVIIGLQVLQAWSGTAGGQGERTKDKSNHKIKIEKTKNEKIINERVASELKVDKTKIEPRTVSINVANYLIKIRLTRSSQ